MQKLILIVLVLLISGCTYSIPSYKSQDKNLSLVKNSSRPIQVIQETPQFDDKGSIACRAAGPVSLQKGNTFSDYITTALKDELRSAGILSESAGAKLHVTVKRVDFSSTMGATNWYIDADYRIDGESFSISTVYHDRSSYVATKACNNMANYFQNAVSEHLNQLYTKSEFKAATGYSEKSNGVPSEHDRFKSLKQLYQDDLITEEEYTQKKKILIDNM